MSRRGEGWRGGEDDRWMQGALHLATRGRVSARPNPVVGAILAAGDESLAQGFHARYGAEHAERAALQQVTGDVPAEATLYVTLEPCAHEGKQPPCAGLLIERGVRRVAIASADPHQVTHGQGPALLTQAGIDVVWAPEQLARIATNQNAGFVTRHRTGRPRVTYKWAMTQNGRLATGDERRWISGEASRMRVGFMRAACGAVVVGIGTVLADDPRLTVRGSAAMGMLRPPLRVVLDRGLRLPLGSQLVQSAAEVPVLVICGSDAPESARQRLQAYGVRVETAADDDTVSACLRVLADAEVNDVLLECGPTLATAFLQADRIDELVCFLAPIEADPAQPGFDDDHPLRQALADVMPERCGDDLVLERRLHDLPLVPIG